MSCAKSKNILQAVNEVRKSISKEKLFSSSSKILLTVSGGQDSIFLLFCLSLLQLQINLKMRCLWCNHFWQPSSFYTTRHLTKCAVSFSSSIIGFVPFHNSEKPWLSHMQLNPSLMKRKKQRASTMQMLVHHKYHCTHKSLQMLHRRCTHLQCIYCRCISNLYFEQRKRKKLALATLPNFFSKFCSDLTFARDRAKVRSEQNLEKNRAFCKKTKYVLDQHIFDCAKRNLYKMYAMQLNAFLIKKVSSVKNTKKILTIPSSFSLQKYKIKSWNNCFVAKEKGKTKFFVKKGCLLKPSPGFPGKARLPGLKEGKGYKKFTGVLSESTARNWRHITSERAGTFYNTERCVSGHSLTDRIETIIFNLIRGAGPRGVTSLPWKRRHSTFCYNKFYPVFEQIKKNTHINLM